MANPSDSASRGSFSLPTGPNFHSPRPPTSASHSSSKKRPWQVNSAARRTSLHSNRSHPRSLPEEHQRSGEESVHSTSRTSGVTPEAAAAAGDKWWKIHFFQGMMNDVKRRGPYYLSDWKDAWDYRVVPATVYMYFAKYDPDKCNFSLFLVHFSVSILLLFYPGFVCSVFPSAPLHTSCPPNPALECRIIASQDAPLS